MSNQTPGTGSAQQPQQPPGQTANGHDTSDDALQADRPVRRKGEPTKEWTQRYNEWAASQPGAKRQAAPSTAVVAAVSAPLDPYLGEAQTPIYTEGLLPPIYERLMIDQCSRHGGVIENYAAGYLPAHATHISGDIQVQTNHNDPDALRSIDGYSLIVGKSSAGKSPCIEVMSEPLLRVVVGLGEDAARRDAKVGGEGRARNVIRHKPLLSDFTLEALNRAMIGNDGRPLGVISDEWSKAIDTAVGNAKGGIAQVFATANASFDNQPINRERVTKDESTFIENSRMSVLLGIQPGVLLRLPYLGDLADNGNFGRMDCVVTNANNAYPVDLLRTDPKAKGAWHEHLKLLRGLGPIICVGGADSAQAVATWTAQQRQQAAIFGDVNESLHQYFNKNGVRLARYAAMFALSDYVADPHGNAGLYSEGHTHPKMSTPVAHLSITLDQYTRAARFIDEFLVPHQIYLHTVMLGGQGQYVVRAKQVLDRVLALGLTQVSRRDLYNTPGLRTKVRNEEWDLTQFGNFMVQSGWLVPAPGAQFRSGSDPGAASQFQVVPGVHVALAPYVPQARVRVGALAVKRESIFGK